MAGSDQKKGAKRQHERLVPHIEQSTSRVSRAARSVSSNEPRSNRATPKQGGRQTSAASKRASPSRQGRRNKKNASSNRRAVDPQDIQLIKWAHSKWSALEPHQQQHFWSSILLGLALIPFLSLTIFSAVPVLNGLHTLLTTFFGWSAYLLALGLVAYAFAHLIEGIRGQRFIRWSMVLGLIVIWLLILIESRLLSGPSPNMGVLAETLAQPLEGWPPPVTQVLLLGGFLLTIVLTFRITIGHVLMAAHFVGGILPQQENPAKTKAPGRSAFLGQRPQYSRYSNSAPPASSPPKAAGGQQRPLDADDEGSIDFEIDSDEEDPLNDITIHKQEISPPSRARREPPLPLDLQAHSNAVRDARQQSLPFTASSEKRAAKRVPEMEPLAPNPNRAAKQQVPDQPSPGESSWKLPDTSLLNNPEEVKLHMLGDDTATLAWTIQETLRSFRVEAEVRQEDISVGPTVVRFGIRPTGKPVMKQDEKGKMVPACDASGKIMYESRTRVSRIMALQNDLALVLEVKTIRMEAPVPGRPYVGVEIPNKNGRLVTLREVLETKEYQAAKAKSKLAIVLGRDVAGQVRVGDLARMPHLLIAGATGSGKSICLNTIIASILTQATPDDVRLLMVDPKMVELNMYNGIPHLLSPVVTEVERVVPLLKNAINEMEQRYRLFSQLSVRNLDGYRKMRTEKIAKGDTSLRNLPAIVIIIDELADLMMAAPEEVEGLICRLAQLARATGIHLVIATQRPSVDVITGLIKANIPTRISFMVSSSVDSRTIIDMGGAERLLGRGDMLYLPADAGRPERIQGAFLADEEAEMLVHYWKQQFAQRTISTRGNESKVQGELIVEQGWEINDDDDEVLDDSNNAGHTRRGDEGHSIADEVADIVAEEKARNEFLRKQATRGKAPQSGGGDGNDEENRS